MKRPSRYLEMRAILLCAYLCFCKSTGNAHLNNSVELQNERTVFNHIFSDYNHKLRPVKDSRTPLLVNVSPVIQNLAAISEKGETLAFNQWLSMLWNDEFLGWNPDDFDQIETIKVPAKEIWIPDLFIMESNPEWKVTAFEANASTIDYMVNDKLVAFPLLKFVLKFERKPEYYIWTIVGPCFLITTIAIIGLFTPNNCKGERQEKVTLGLTTLLTMAVMLTLVTEEMPKSNEQMPLLGRFIMYEICLISISICISVAILKVHETAITTDSKLLKYVEKRCKRKGLLYHRSKNYSFEGLEIETDSNEHILYRMGREIGSCCQMLGSMNKMVTNRLNEEKTDLMLAKVFDWIDTLMMVCVLCVQCLLTFVLFHSHLS